MLLCNIDGVPHVPASLPSQDLADNPGYRPVCTPTSVAQEFQDRDTREISSYVLTESGLAKYTQATHNLGDAAKQLSSHCDDEEDVNSLDELVARIDAIPAARAAIKSAA